MNELTIRDIFACFAMVGLFIARPNASDEHNVKRAYEIADLMEEKHLEENDA